MDLISILQSVGYAGVWVTIFCESAFLFGVLFPGDSLLFPIGILAGQNVFNLWVMLPGCFIAAFLGNLAGYEIGNRWGPALLRTKYAKRFVKDEHLKKCHHFFEKYGASTVAIVRFVHFARTFVPFVAGMTRMNYRLFVMYSALGAALWAMGIPLLGYFVGNALPDGSIDKYLLPIISIIVLMVAFPAIKKAIKTHFSSKTS